MCNPLYYSVLSSGVLICYHFLLEWLTLLTERCLMIGLRMHLVWLKVAGRTTCNTKTVLRAEVEMMERVCTSSRCISTCALPLWWVCVTAHMIVSTVHVLHSGWRSVSVGVFWNGFMIIRKCLVNGQTPFLIFTHLTTFTVLCLIIIYVQVSDWDDQLRAGKSLEQIYNSNWILWCTLNAIIFVSDSRYSKVLCLTYLGTVYYTCRSICDITCSRHPKKPVVWFPPMMHCCHPVIVSRDA